MDYYKEHPEQDPSIDASSPSGDESSIHPSQRSQAPDELDEDEMHDLDVLLG